MFSERGKWETLQSTDLAFKTWQYRAKFTDFKGLLMTLILPTWSVVSSSELPWLRKRCLKPFDSSLKDFSSAVLSSPRTCLASWEQHWGRQCWQTLRQALAVLTALPLTAQDRLKKNHNIEHTICHRNFVAIMRYMKEMPTAVTVWMQLISLC